MTMAQNMSDDIESILGIPYTEPFIRFLPPVATKSPTPPISTSHGSICPQNPSRLQLVTGPLPPGSGRQDESSCGVLSVYRPVHANNLPIIAWLHGGAFVTGGSEIPWYDGSRLARDGNVIAITISYRLGVFGLLENDNNVIQPATQDVIMGLEWIRDNARRLGGDPNRITLFGQSAGAYMIQVLTDIRPDLFSRAIIQSSPAGGALTNDQAVRIRESVEQHLNGTSLTEASTTQILNAQAAVLSQNSNLILAFSPISRDGLAPGGRKHSGQGKQVLVAWTQDDGSIFAELRMRDRKVPKLARAAMLPLIKSSVTRSDFEQPARELAARLKERGYETTMFKHTWVPKGFEHLGAAHCTDLPLVWGSEAAWRNAPMLGNVPWSEWESRGREYRQALGQFAAEGITPPAKNGRVIVT